LPTTSSLFSMLDSTEALHMAHCENDGNVESIEIEITTTQRIRFIIAVLVWIVWSNHQIYDNSG
jgi:hypothetical protein